MQVNGKQINTSKLIKTSIKNWSFVMLSFLLLIFVNYIPKTLGSDKTLLGIIGKSLYAETYTEVIPSVNIIDESKLTIDKSAEWTGVNEATVRFDVESKIQVTNIVNKDIILVVDTSQTMNGERIDKVKEDAIVLIEDVLSDSSNRMGIITFNTDATIIQDFTNNSVTMNNQIDSLTTAGRTNYNAALKKVIEMLSTYTVSSNRELLVFFLTDGFPTDELHNEIGTYEQIKSLYPNIIVQGIQYEMSLPYVGSDLTNISDNQFLATITNLQEVLYQSLNEEISKYEVFTVEDYVDSKWTVNSVDDIYVSIGSVELTTENGLQKIIWTYPPNIRTGFKAYMTIKQNLKSEYHTTGGYYPTNDNENIVYRLDGSEQTNTSVKTPVLKNLYNVYYDDNVPTGCTSLVSQTPIAYAPKASVTIDNGSSLKCNGYTFKGYSILDNEDIEYINDEIFVMPDRDVYLKGEWAKIGVEKAMDGVVVSGIDLYTTVVDSATSVKYTGNGYTSFDKDVYVEQSNDANNVVFANHCWKIIRTTETGGVKLLYNGEADSNNQCGTTRGTHLGYVWGTTPTVTNNLYYGTDYVWDSTNNVFKLAGTISQVIYDGTNFDDIKGKYTCRSTSSSEDTCSSISLITSNYNRTGTSITSVGISNTSNYSIFGSGEYTKFTNSLGYVGYMFSSQTYIALSDEPASDLLFSSTVSWNGTNYTLNSPQAGIDNSRHYTCASNSVSTCTQVRYYYYNDKYILLTGGDDIEAAKQKMISTSATQNSTNEIDSHIKTLVDKWYEHYMLNYSSYLEDTVFCNNRSVGMNGGWIESGSISSFMYLYGASTGRQNLICNFSNNPTLYNPNDSFSVGSTQAHLTYPVGLITNDEVRLMGASAASGGADYWSMSTYGMFGSYTFIGALPIGADGTYGTATQADYSRGVRPVISLKPGIKYTTGDGTTTSPYMIKE